MVRDVLLGSVFVAIAGSSSFLASSWLLPGPSGEAATESASTATIDAQLRSAQLFVDEASGSEATPTPAPSIEEEAEQPEADDEATSVLPLADLSAQADAIAQEMSCCVSIAVVVPEGGETYEYQGYVTWPLLSVAKVPIMMTLLDQAAAEGRELDDAEMELMSRMVQLSDNNAAYSLWDEIGGAEAMSAYLESVGIDGVVTYPDGWGSTLASPMQMATLLAMLVEGDVLDASSRTTAMDLLSSVDPSQEWGALAGTEGSGAEAGIKNGWYPETDGWALNSLAYVMPEDGPPYVIAISVGGYAYMTDGIETIEEIARILNAELLAD